MYQALALKYRPKQFDLMVGQEGVVNTIRGALKSQKLSHAYLFSGLRGSGKTTTARIFAKALICENGPTDKPCETCEHCMSANDGRHLDIVEMDGASNRKIEDIRNLIENSKYKPLSARYKIYIIDEVHMLTKEAFNALLKTLEEPPEYVKFILATTDPIKVPATILSRTIHFRFNKIPHKKVVEHLRWILDSEKISHEEEALEIVARSGDGSIRDTLTLLDQAIVYCKNRVTTEGTTQMLGLIDPSKIGEIFKIVMQKDRAKVVQIARELEDYDAETVLSEFAEYLKAQFLKNDSLIPTFAMDRFIRVVAEAKSLFFIGADGSFTLVLALLKMIEAMENESIDELIAKYESKAVSSMKNETIPQEALVKTEQPIKSEPPLQTNTKIVDESQKNGEKWAKFLEETKNRNLELGVMLENVLTFEGFSDNVLSWSSSANEAQRELFRRDYAIVSSIVKRVFGIDTTIKLVPASMPPKKSEEKIELTVEKNDKTSEDIAKTEHIEEEPLIIHTPTADIAAGSSLIGMQVASKCDDEALKKSLGLDSFESDTQTTTSLLEHPLVQKTIELFGASQDDVVLHSKTV